MVSSAAGQYNPWRNLRQPQGAVYSFLTLNNERPLLRQQIKSRLTPMYYLSPGQAAMYLIDLE
jgi:hypothetical protein